MEEVSVAILQYNPNWDKLKRTILSVLRQEEVKVEIVISDDGSQNNYFDKITQLMAVLHFSNYKLISGEDNCGTVINAIHALENCTHPIVKLISPGDLLYKEDSLNHWVSCFIKNRWEISFGDAVFYSYGVELEVHEVEHHPANMSIYKNEKELKLRQLNYLLLRDQVSGASCLVNREIYLKYLYRIRNHVIYTEDFAFRLMVYDGFDFHYFPECVIWYEYGTGISTQKNTKWEKLIRKDDEECDNIILKSEPSNAVSRKYVTLLKYDDKFNHNKYIRKILKILMFPQLIYLKLKRTLFSCHTPVGDKVDFSFFNAIVAESDKILL